MKKEEIYMAEGSIEMQTIIGIIDFGYPVWKCKVIVNGFEDNCVPHFHIEALESTFHTNICIYDEAYFLHNPDEEISRFSDFEYDICKDMHNKLNLWLKTIINYHNPVSIMDIIRLTWKSNNPDNTRYNHLCALDKTNLYDEISFDIILIKEDILRIRSERVYGINVAHMGYIDFPNRGKCEVTVLKFEDDYEPHMHICSKDKSFSTCICIHDNKYFPPHEKINSVQYLTIEECEIFDDWLNNIGDQQMTNWEWITLQWNMENLKNNNTIKPNYTTIKPYKCK